MNTVNFQLVRQKRLPNGRLPVYLCSLRTLLNRLAVPKQALKWKSGRKLRSGGGAARVQLGTKRAPTEATLWEKYELSRCLYRERIRRTHPDRNGDHAAAAELNGLWREIERRFKRHGIRR